MANLKGLGLFMIGLVELVGSGVKESITTIEKHIDDNDIVEFLSQKYDDILSIKFDNSIYDNKAINKYFSNYSGVVDGNESRKFGVSNEEDGVLLLIALIADIVETKCIKWEIDTEEL